MGHLDHASFLLAEKRLFWSEFRDNILNLGADCGDEPFGLTRASLGVSPLPLGVRDRQVEDGQIIAAGGKESLVV